MDIHPERASGMKKLRVLVIFVAACFCSVGCASNDGVVATNESARSSPLEIVPLLRIIARPEDFSGQPVTVSGILDSDGRGAYLYLTRSAFDVFDLSLGVRVLFSMDQREMATSLHGKYVVATGTVDYQDWAHPKQIVLDGIRRIEALPSRD